MRWLVEVTSLGKTEKDSLYVDADTWQKALQVARTLRGETEPMSGFSIELLEDGCRAVDPVSRMTYEVQRADEGRPAPVRASVAPPPQAAVAAPPASAPISAGPEGVPRPRGPISVRPPISASATMMLGAGPPAVSANHVAPAAPAGFPAPDGRRNEERRSVAPPPAVSSLPSQIIFKREQEATQALPLTYREYVFVVPPGSSEMAAATFVQAQLELVRSALERAPAGKLVNLAVFDVTFQGRPPVPPLATLSWKDWRGAALVSFPRQPGRAPITIPMGGPPAPVEVPAAAAPAVAPVPVAAPVPVPVPAANPFAPPRSVPSSANPFAPAPIPNPFVPAQAAPVPQAFAQAADPFAPVSRPPQPVTAAPPQPFIPANPGFETPAPPYGRPLVSPVAPAVAPIVAAAAPEPPSRRIHGEDLIADLFESMHDLHFARDAVEGGDFCLSLAMAKLPSLAGIVELYDIDRREFLVACTRGEGTRQLLLRRFPETDSLLSAAMRKRRAVVIEDAGQSEAATNERYVAIGGARSLLIAPVMLAGRFLGAIELVNPIDGLPFTESDGNAVTYIAQQLAEFVAERGIVTDPERINAPRP